MTEAEYSAGAKKLAESACGGDILGHIDTEHRIVRFNKATGEFTKMHIELGIYTYFKAKIGEGLSAALSYYEKAKEVDERENAGGSVQCPICGLYEFEMYADFVICPECGWENDGVQMYYPDEKQGANWLSQNQYRTYWIYSCNANGEQKSKLDTCPVCWESKVDKLGKSKSHEEVICSVCGNNEFDYTGNCTVCDWYETDYQREHPDETGCIMNAMSLNYAKEYWKKYGRQVS
jgi:ribosomal protein L37E